MSVNDMEMLNSITKDPIPDDCKEIPDNIKQSGESDPSRDRGSMEQGKDGYDR